MIPSLALPGLPPKNRRIDAVARLPTQAFVAGMIGRGFAARHRPRQTGHDWRNVSRGDPAGGAETVEAVNEPWVAAHRRRVAVAVGAGVARPPLSPLI